MLSIIIVNYKNEDKTIKFVREELSKVVTPHITIIVNNAATNESNTTLTKNLGAELITNISIPPSDKSKCFIIPQKDNLGFAKGNNLGVAFSINFFESTHILFSNTDIKFKDSNVVETLINRIEEFENVGMIGPKIIGEDNLPQSPEPYFPFWNRYFWMFWITPFIPTKIKTKLFKLDYHLFAEEGFHYKVMGSFFLVRCKDFIKCGMMDPNTFLFAEEVILSERLSKIGKKVYFYPRVTVIHEHGYTISKSLNTKEKLIEQFKSEHYYYSTYKNVSNLSLYLGKLSFLIYLKLKKHL
jgi:GT2 family glycosyltransferase